MAFRASEFTFDGVSCFQYDLMLCGFGSTQQSSVSFGNQGNIIETKIPNRIHPIHFGVNFHDNPLQFTLVFGSERELDRYELEAISIWLTGHQDYRWLTIDQPDMVHVAFKCIITRLTPLTSAGMPVAFEATVRCDCPYAYGYPFSESFSVNGSRDVLFRNGSSINCYFKPDLHYQPSGTGKLQIVNHDDGDRVFLIDTALTNSMEITVDNKNGILREKSGINLYQFFNMKFFRVVRGDNHLTITGNGLVTISGRFLHNVAA